jgi:hypothetical protein
VLVRLASGIRAQAGSLLLRAVHGVRLGYLRLVLLLFRRFRGIDGDRVAGWERLFERLVEPLVGRLDGMCRVGVRLVGLRRGWSGL